MDAKQKQILRSMRPDQKIEISLSLYHFARQLKAAGLRSQNPEWNEKRIQEKVREIFLYARV